MREKERQTKRVVNGLANYMMVGDRERVRSFVIEWFEFDPSERLIDQIIALAEKSNWRWSCDYVWLKSRLVGLGVFRTLGMVTDIAFKTPLHFFFLHIDETPEMIARLQNERVVDEPTPARSKVFADDSLIPVPIDRTALRVARPNFWKKSIEL